MFLRTCEVESFSTERGSDVLVVNGVEYSGSAGPNGIVPHGTIRWRAAAQQKSYELPFPPVSSLKMSVPSSPKDDYTMRYGWNICLRKAWPARLTLLGHRVCGVVSCMKTS